MTTVVIVSRYFKTKMTKSIKRDLLRVGGGRV